MTITNSTDRIIVVSYDHEARAQYQKNSDKPIAKTVEDPEGTYTDLASDGTVVGIEKLW